MKRVLFAVLLMLLAVPAFGQIDSTGVPLVKPMQFIVGVGTESPAPLGNIESVTWETMTSFAWAQLIIPVADDFLIILDTEQVMQRDRESLERPDFSARIKVGYRLF